jgi:hypothetical protein
MRGLGPSDLAPGQLDMSRDITMVMDIAPLREVTMRDKGAYGEVIP